MSEQTPKPTGLVERILEEARLAAEGSASVPVAIIEAGDRDLLRAIKRGSDPERQGLLLLLHKLGARGKRVAEQALAAGGLGSATHADLLGYLAEREPRHALVTAYQGILPALERSDLKGATEALLRLPAALRALWAAREAGPLLAPLSPGLAALLEESPEAASAVLDSLGRDTPTAALDALATFGRSSDARHLAKGLRAAFFRLQQIGASVPELSPASVPALGRGSEPPREEHAWLSPVDPSGDRALWIAEELAEGGYAVLQAVLSDDGGMRMARALVVTRKGYASLRASLAEDQTVPMAEIELPLAMGYVEDAYARNPAAAGRDYAHWRRAQHADRRARRPEPVAFEAAEAERLSAASAELFRDGGLPLWLLDRAEAERAQSIVREALDSPLVLPDAETAARRTQALEKAAGTVLSPARRARFRHRFEANAAYLRARDQQREAAIAAAAAAAIDGGRVPQAMVRIVEESLLALARLHEKESQEAGKKEAPAKPAS